VNEPTVTITGNLGADPEIRYTPAGRACASFSIAATPRYRDTGTGEWADGETWWVRCTAWRDLGENAAECLRRGMAVVATGRLRARSWQAEDGTARSAVEMTVDDIGPSLRRATVKVTRTTREHAPATGTPAARDPWQADRPATPAADDKPPF
jgi:single-strand DNA-binding protein